MKQTKSKQEILDEYKRIFEIREIRDRIKLTENREVSFYEAIKYLKNREVKNGN